MSNPVIESCQYTNITSTTTIKTGAGKLLGIFCASGSAPTVKVSDGAATIVNTFTPYTGSFTPIPACFSTSLIVTIGGTADVTVFWDHS